MTKQRDLFERFSEPVTPCDPHVECPQEEKRLTGQNAKILERLRRGPADNVELSRMALKYTSRISDLRSRGYDIRVIQRNHGNGICVYQLFE